MNKFATNDGSKPLIVGAPRTGFSLLINVIVRLLPLTANKVSRQDHIIRAFVELAGNHVSNAIIRETEKLGLYKDLVFNPNFRYLAGGPRWIPPEEPDVACFRKYVGIRGHGDFTLITKHPRELFESGEILHTHSNPAFWVTNPVGDGLAAFASQRNPVGTLYSSCFSLNALASEYLQHFVPPEQDSDELREQLALYKLTDLKFFAGLISPLKKYLEEFVEVRDRYRYVMGWENLLTYPAQTIIEVGAAMGVEVDEDLAMDIWKEISWRNLTGWHKHNYRRGHGIIGGWRRYLTNQHLALMRDMGLEQLSLKMGYGLIPDLDPSGYTPYQKQVAAMLARGEIYRDYPDRWMFEFAFNKSNLDSSAYPFKRYDWRENTQVERSSVDHENIVMPVWDAAEAATGAFNRALSELLVFPFDAEAPPKEALRSFIASHAGLYDQTEDAAIAMLESAWEGKRAEPRLLRTIRGRNIVQFGPIYYGLPQTLGPIDLLRTDPSNMPGVIKADSYASLTRTLIENTSRVLEFVTPDSEAYSTAILDAIQNGALSISIYPATAPAKRLAATLRSRISEDVGLTVLAELPAELSPTQGYANRPSVFVLMPENDEELPELLLKFLDWEGGWIIAPQTPRFYANNPLFLISVPKAGTHLLYELARQMGYRDGVELTGFAVPAHWYCLEYSNSHTAAPDFFIDSVRRNPFGNRTHPFPGTPTLFIYRNPLDILVSEANYYHRDGRTSFSGYLSNLSFEQRVERLISDPWLLGSIRDRIAKFLAWLEFPNVIPVSYEELVGTHGGGDDCVRENLIWSLQLKLQVPGRPARIAGSLLDRDSPTFHKGKIGGYREALSDQAFAGFCKLDQDFMRVLGYAGSDKKNVPFPPARAEEFRGRLLQLSVVDHGGTAVTVGTFLGCNLVTYRRRFYAIPQRLGELNLTALEPSLRESFVSAKDVGELKNLLLLGRENYEHAWQGSPHLLEEDYFGFNLIAYANSIWAAKIAVGPIDFSDHKVIRKWLAEGRLLRAATVEEVREAIDQLRQSRGLFGNR